MILGFSQTFYFQSKINAEFFKEKITVSKIAIFWIGEGAFPEQICIKKKNVSVIPDESHSKFFFALRKCNFSLSLL